MGLVDWKLPLDERIKVLKTSFLAGKRLSIREFRELKESIGWSEYRQMLQDKVSI